MRETSNPVFRSLPKQQGGYAQFGTGVAGAQQVGYQTEAPYYTPQTGVSRPMTIDDVVTKTGITLAVLSAVAVVSYFLVSANVALAMPFTLVGALGGLALVLVATFGRKQDNPAIVLSYAALEGLFLGAISLRVREPLRLRRQRRRADRPGHPRHGRGVRGHVDRLQDRRHPGHPEVHPHAGCRAWSACWCLMLGNFVSRCSASARRGPGLRNGGPLAIVFSLVCIALAAFSFLLDFDAADQMIRAGAPEKAAWGVALGLTVTLVWLYLEILRLLSYFQRN